jgi:CheY-like chemotaxis protein
VARILVVDDEHDIRELFNITLKMAGHVTDTAKDGLEAVDKLSKNDAPDLILLDLMMPNLNGFELLAHIRKEMDSKPCRVLVATAKVLEDADQQKLNSWPVVGVLNKGELDIGQMVVIVSTALSKNPHKNGDQAETKKSEVRLTRPDAAKTGSEPPAAEKHGEKKDDKAGEKPAEKPGTV